METRTLGRTGRPVSMIGLGCWQLGGDWGSVSEDDAMGVLHAAVDAGVTVLDTADVYGDGRSERLVGEDDHRNDNRSGEAFDVGETFSGVPYDVGVKAARQVAALTPQGAPTAQLALRWLIDQPGVTTVIPGARNAEQARGNAAAADLPPLTDEQLEALREVYDGSIREHVHDRW